MYDLIIVGAGPAGITAGIYAARKRMDFLIITKDLGGQATWSGDIENYTGYQFITGPELVGKFEEHLRKHGIKLNENEEVVQLRRKDNLIEVKSNKDAYLSKTVIIASGKRSKELGIPSEAEFKNRGLTYCATCDGPLFADRDVAVVGGGNSALDATLQLINIANHIYLINIAHELTGDPIMGEKIKKSEKVSILNNTRITRVIGEKMVTGIGIREETGSPDKEKNLDVQGVFVEIGLIPNSEFAEGVDKNENGEIMVDCRNRTNITGVFAAGDVTNVPGKQIIIAAGEGATATLEAFRHIASSED